CALLAGPHTENFKEVVETLDAAKAVDIVSDAMELASRVSALLADDAKRATQAARAAQAAQDLAGVTDKVWDHIVSLLPNEPSSTTSAPTGDQS
ncbi:MAG: hypothetical protein KUG59_00510, partial [Parvibaculaceae bacterium]|nr:hypothetical protein [Parvibaculaceae bacterium]